MMKPRLFALAVVMTLGRTQAARAAEFVYASTDAGTLYQYRIGADGSLRPLTPPSIPAFDRAARLVLHPSGRFAYAVAIHERNAGHAVAQVLGFRVGRDGRFSPMTPQPLTLAAPADNVTMDPKGRFLFVSGENDRLFTFRVRPDGALVPLPDNKDVPTFRIDTQGDGGGELTGVFSEDVLSLDPSGRYLYVFANTGFVDHREHQFAPYRLDTRGALHPLAPATYGPGQSGNLLISPRGDVFVSRYFLDKQGTYRFHVGSRGLLVPAMPPVLPDQFALFLTEGSEGETLWTAFQDHPLASYHVGRGGRLSLESAHAGTLPGGRQTSADRRGRFFYVADYPRDKPGSSLVAYAATAQGTLKALAGPPQTLDGGCVSLCVKSEAGFSRPARRTRVGGRGQKRLPPQR